MITNFRNITNPDQVPVDGDGVSYELNGRTITTNWDWNVLHQLLKVTEQGNPITKLEFRRLFPMSTLVAVDNFEYDTTLSDAVKAQLRTINAGFSIASAIDLTDADVEMALSYYVSIGFMGEPEKLTVLTGGLA